MKRKSVVGILTCDGKILLLKRHPYDRTLPNFYCLPGGKVDENESLETALIREVKEETNIDIDGCTFFVKDENEKFEINFFKVETTATNVTISDEHESYMWMELADLALYQDLIAPVTFKALKTLWSY